MSDQESFDGRNSVVGPLASHDLSTKRHTGSTSALTRRVPLRTNGVTGRRREEERRWMSSGLAFLADRRIEAIDLERGTRGQSDLSESEKRDIIREALGPNADGTSKDSELDLLTGDEDYLEAKSGDIDREDLRDKLIRYKAHQLTGDVSSSGTMRVIGRPGEFTYSGRDELRKVGAFIDNSDGIARDDGVVTMAEDERIDVYCLYRDGDPAAIERAHERALEAYESFEWDGPFLRTPFGTVSVGCEAIAAEMTGMESPENQTYESGDDEWDLFDSPLCV